MVATGVIIVGNIIIVLSGNKTSDSYDLAELWDLFLRPAFIIYLAITLGLVGILQSFYWALLWGYFPYADPPAAWAVR
jgi:hypothetical protein